MDGTMKKSQRMRTRYIKEFKIEAVSYVNLTLLQLCRQPSLS